MSAPLTAPILRAIRVARRRLVLQLAVQRFATAWAAALALGLGWVLAEPWLIAEPHPRLKWGVIGGLLAVATLVAGWLVARWAPTREVAALELDSRFGLKERLTTALGLRPEDAATPAGQAVVTDAAAKAAPLAVRTKFPVRPGRPAALVPVLAAGIVAAAVFYHPDTSASAGTTDPDAKATDASAVTQKGPDPSQAKPFVKPPTTSELDRANKSEKLTELENELEKLLEKYAKDPNGESPEKQREKVTEITALEEKAKKFDQEKFEKLSRLEQQLRQLDRLKNDDTFRDGPAKEFNDALAKGDLKKAKEEVDELRKKAKKDKLTPDEQEKLARQLDKMKDEVEKLNRNKEREDKLKDLIDKAKKEGRDADALERELDQLKQENQQASDDLKELAERFQRAKQAAERGDLDELARELEQAGKQLENIEGELKDLEDAQEYLQRLKEEKDAACKKCQGQGKGDKFNGPNDSDEPNDGGIGAGRRPENKDAKTASEDERIKGLFDPRGKKSYGGTTRGPAFTKRTTVDMGKEISEAVQEAPQAADTQRLPRDARDAVKGYFENLGGQAPGGNK